MNPRTKQKDKQKEPMLSRITLTMLLLWAYIIGCAPATPPGEPPPVQSATQADTEPNDTMNATGGEGSTGGYACDESYAQYECHGFVAGIYSTDSNPTNYQFVNISDGQSPSSILNAWECLNGNLVTVCAPGPIMDSLMLAAQCKEACESLTWDAFPAAHGAWQLRGVVCEFQPGGNNGYVHDPIYGEIGTTSPSCSSADDAIQFPNVGGNDACVGACDEAQCEGWKPSDYVTSRLNSFTKTYTTSIDKDFLLTLFQGQMENLYGCDGARYQQFLSTSSPPVETHKVTFAAAGDLLYVLGLRTNDTDFKIRKTGCSSCAWTSLQLSANFPGALLLLYDEPYVTLSFKRGTQTYTMNLTIN
jgi:hypothetical protein